MKFNKCFCIYKNKILTLNIYARYMIKEFRGKNIKFNKVFDVYKNKILTLNLTANRSLMHGIQSMNVMEKTLNLTNVLV